MAKKVRTVSELKYQIQSVVMEAMAEDVLEVVKDEQVEKIQEVVYNAYEPKEYERREGKNGGLSDKDMMIPDIDVGKNEITLMVTNQATGNPEYGTDDVFIAPIVEHGHSGGYGYYDYPTDKNFTEPRRFQKATIESLNQNKKHIEALKASLKKAGFKVK